MLSNYYNTPRAHLHRKVYYSLLQKDLISFPLETTDDALFTSEYFAEILISRGWVRRIDYYQTLSEILNLDLFDPNRAKFDLSLSVDSLYAEYKRYSFLPISQSANGTVAIITNRMSTDLIELLGNLYKSYKIIIASPDDLSWLMRKRFENIDLYNSSNLLHEINPDASAKVLVSKTSIAVAAVLIGLSALFMDTIVVVYLALAIFVSTHLLKIYLFLSSLEFSYEFLMDNSLIDQVDINSLPTYSIIVALYKEKEVVPQLIKALSRLDYPQEKLDIKLVIEEEDEDTLNAINDSRPPQNMETIIVPGTTDIEISKTKPRACNYALPYCTGEYVALYDAEDVPDRLQLKKAASYFKNSKGDISCLQAKLNFYNSKQNMLTEMFDMEYRIWFKLFLPGLHLMQSPIPLGGTSNHFKKDVLETLGGWDAYNVTEDADLGIRMFLEGHKVGLLDSDTPEECPSTFGSWIKQRSRWIKGHLITYLVHNRNPIKLLQKLGFKNYMVLTLFIFFPVVSFLLYPVLWGIYIADLFNLDVYGLDSLLFPAELEGTLMLALLIPNLIYIFLAMVISIKDKRYSDLPLTLLQPLYWVLHSIAAYYAVYEAIRRPHHWNKTAHGVSFYDG
jgi:cellulose synthase/poly-beta-1,6-N-acetylglucosamine synthase-like glycosyltransferase